MLLEKYIRSYLETVLGHYSQYYWLFQIAIILLVAGIIYFVAKRMINTLKQTLADTQNIWDDSFFHALSVPLSFFIWFVALTSAVQFLISGIDESGWSGYVSTVRQVGVVFILNWFVWRFISKIEAKMVIPYAWRRPSDPTTVSIVARLLRIFSSLIVVMLLMQAFGLPVTGIWAFGGGGTIILGIAAQDLLANFFGGLMIFLDRPFKVGDWINSPDRNIEGTVQFIGWRTTKVITFDRRPLYLPNSIFTKIIIVNPQRMTNRRINPTIGIRYDDAQKIKPIIEDIKSMLKAHAEIDQKQPLMVHFVNFGASSLDINLYCFTKTTNWNQWREVQQDVFLQVLAIVEKHDAEVAFPTRTLNIAPSPTLPGEVSG